MAGIATFGKTSHMLTRFFLFCFLLFQINSLQGQSQQELYERYQEQQREMQGVLGKSAPQFSVIDVNGVKHDLSNYLGKVVVLNFWFINCPPCRKEIPELNQLVKQYDRRDIVFLAPATDSKSRLKSFLKKNDFDYAVVPNGRKIASKYKVSGYPTNVVINKKGKVVFYEKGYRGNTETLEAAIKATRD